MKEGNSASKILQGAFILSVALILSKLIGTIQKIPLQNIGGDVVFGIYNTVYPFYIILITIAVLGVPAAVSKFVAENEARGRAEDNLRIVRLSSVFVGAVGVIIGAVVYLMAPLLASWIGNSYLVSAIRSVALALLFVPIMSLLRGYFQGLQNMIPTAVSQVTEQGVRVAFMVAVLLYMTELQATADQVAAGAMLGSAVGGIAGLLVMLLYWVGHRRRTYAGASQGQITAVEGRQLIQEKKPSSRVIGHWGMLKMLLLYGIPICLSALSVPLMGLVDSLSMPRLLRTGGASELFAMVEFGVYNRGIPLVQLVTMLATSLSVLFIPALADARVRGDEQLLKSQCRLSLRWFWLLGLASSVGLAVLAQPINVMLYQDTVGTETIRWLSFTAAGSTMSIISAALLQGLGNVKAPAIHLLTAAVVKVLLNLLLVPSLGITGAAVAGVIAHFLAAVLNVRLLVRSTRLSISWSDTIGKPLLVVASLAAAAGLSGWLMKVLLAYAGVTHERLAALMESIFGIVIGVIVFLIAAVSTKLLQEEEMLQVPKLGPKLVKGLKRIRLL